MTAKKYSNLSLYRVPIDYIVNAIIALFVYAIFAYFYVIASRDIERTLYGISFIIFTVMLVWISEKRQAYREVMRRRWIFLSSILAIVLGCAAVKLAFWA